MNIGGVEFFSHS